jgi:peptidyl-prolyl cis-trans isomerase C
MKLRLVFVTLCAAAAAGCPVSLSGGGASAGGAGGKAPSHTPGAGDPIATIGDVTLTTGDLEARLNKQSPFVRARYASAERKQEFLDNQVRFEVLAKEAFKRGYHNDPEVVESLKKILVQKVTREEFDGRVSLKDITDAEIKAYYDQHTDDYNKPEMVRSSHIFVPFGADKAAAQQKAEQVQKIASAPATLEDREHFKKLVAEHSADEQTRRTGGDLRYLSNKELTERFGEAAAQAIWSTEKINDVTAVAEGKEGFHIFKRTGRRKPIERSIDQVRNQIRNVLYREKRTDAFQQFVEGLKTEFGVTVFPDRLDQVKVEAGSPGAPSPHGIGDGHGHGGPPAGMTPPPGAGGNPPASPPAGIPPPAPPKQESATR